MCSCLHLLTFSVYKIQRSDKSVYPHLPATQTLPLLHQRIVFLRLLAVQKLAFLQGSNKSVYHHPATHTLQHKIVSPPPPRTSEARFSPIPGPGVKQEHPEAHLSPPPSPTIKQERLSPPPSPKIKQEHPTQEPLPSRYQITSGTHRVHPLPENCTKPNPHFVRNRMRWAKTEVESFTTEFRSRTRNWAKKYPEKPEVQVHVQRWMTREDGLIIDWSVLVLLTLPTIHDCCRSCSVPVWSDSLRPATPEPEQPPPPQQQQVVEVIEILDEEPNPSAPQSHTTILDIQSLKALVHDQDKPFTFPLPGSIPPSAAARRGNPPNPPLPSVKPTHIVHKPVPAPQTSVEYPTTTTVPPSNVARRQRLPNTTSPKHKHRHHYPPRTYNRYISTTSTPPKKRLNQPPVVVDASTLGSS